MRNVIINLLFILFVFNLSAQEINWRDLEGNNQANFYDIQKAFYEYWKDKTPSKGQGYKVFKRWEQKMIPRVYPSGKLNQSSNTYLNFSTWTKANKISERSPNGNWIEVGPLSKPIGYDAGVGRVDFIKFSPTNSNVAYVSTPDGGLWKTNNLLDALPIWTTYNDFLPVIGCSDLAIDPNGTTMYLATGSWESDKNSIGIWKSVNGGETWSPTSLVFELSNFYKISRIIMDPTNSQIMMAATSGGLFRTTDGWATHDEVPTLGFGNNIQDIKFNPGNNQIVYASGKHTSPPQQNRVFWRSIDNGVNWTNITAGLPNNSDVSRVLIGVSVANSAYVYLLAGNNDGGFQGLYRSTDSGLNFNTQSTSPNILNTDWPPTGNNGQATHDMAIAIAPNDINKVTVGGINQVRSTNGGVNWNILTYWNGLDSNFPGYGSGSAPYLHADVQSITYYPGSNSTIYSSCDGSISRSTDDGATWMDISNNLRIAQQTDIALASDDAIMITGLQDIGNLKNIGNPAWTYIGGGDGESTFIDYTNNDNIVTSEPNGGHSYSNDGGVTKYNLVSNGLPAGTEFYSPIIQDPVTHTTCYAGGRPDLYKSTNFKLVVTDGHSWSSIGTPSGSSSVLRFAVAPSDPDIIYTLKEDAVSKTVNGGDSWSNISTGLPLMDAYVRNIAVSNTNPLKVWVVFSGYSATTKVFKTEDGGVTWVNVSSGLPNIPFNVVRYRDGSNDEVYIGADIGVYVTNNSLSGTWVPFIHGLANSTVNDLEIYYPTGKIRAATYGRGSWESNLYTGNPTVLLAARVFLEGPYNSGAGTMNDGLRTSHYIPSSDPYPGLGYTHVMGELEGTNTATLIKSDEINAIVDWVFVELRDQNNPTTRLFTRSALIQRDGDIVDMDGVSPLHFSNAPADNYYIAFRHRNHLGFRTNATISLSGTVTNLDFTTNAISTFGMEAIKQIHTGVYGMYSGDANRDGEVNAFDLNAHWKLQNSLYGYRGPDFNLDGEVNSFDLNSHWNVNNSRVQQLD